MFSLQVDDRLPGSVPTRNCLLDWEHRITTFQPRGDLHGNFLPPLHFLGEGGKSIWRSSVTSSPARTEPRCSARWSFLHGKTLSPACTSWPAGWPDLCIQLPPGHLHLAVPWALHTEPAQANSSLSNCPPPGVSVPAHRLLGCTSQNGGVSWTLPSFSLCF